MADLPGSEETLKDQKITALENRMAALEMKIPRTELLNGSFLKRAFVVWGHYFVANLIIGAGFFFCFMMFWLVLAAAGIAFFN